jgi:gluconolactonase
MTVRICLLALPCLALATARGGDLPPAAEVKPVKLIEVPHYSEGVVFDREGRGYLSEDRTIWRFTLEGHAEPWATTGAPNGHKILADGTHLVCDASRHAVLRLSPDGKLLPNAASECDGKPLRGPNDLTLDTAHGGFYFTDPGGSDEQNPIGTVHYVDAAGNVSLVVGEMAFPNGIVLTPDGKCLYVAESKRNVVRAYPVDAPGKVSPRFDVLRLPEKDESAGQIDNQPDGMCLDAEGNLYVAHFGMHQVQVLNPEGRVIRRYEAGTLTTSNVAFGGPNMDQLFVTGALANEQRSGAVFRLDLGIPGLLILPAQTR